MKQVRVTDPYYMQLFQVDAEYLLRLDADKLTALAQAYKQTEGTDPDMNSEISQLLDHMMSELKIYQDRQSRYHGPRRTGSTQSLGCDRGRSCGMIARSSR